MWFPSANEIRIQANNNYVKSFWLAHYATVVQFWNHVVISVLMPYTNQLLMITIALWNSTTHMLGQLFVAVVAAVKTYIYGVTGYLDGARFVQPNPETDFSQFGGRMSPEAEAEVVAYVKAQREQIESEKAQSEGNAQK
jgi:hypothetical protein